MTNTDIYSQTSKIYPVLIAMNTHIIQNTINTGDIACRKELTGCCCCDLQHYFDPCPEWTKDEVVSLLVLDLKMSGIIAFASVL